MSNDDAVSMVVALSGELSIVTSEPGRIRFSQHRYRRR